MKTCSWCRVEKPATRKFFDVDSRVASGLTARCKACRNLYGNAYASRNRLRVRALHKQWRTDNPEKTKAHQLKVSADLKRAIVAAYGSVCGCCGEAEIAFLTVEHSRRDGHLHRQRTNNGVYHDLKRRGFPQDEGIELLCMNCNFARRWGKVCPHQLRVSMVRKAG